MADRKAMHAALDAALDEDSAALIVAVWGLDEDDLGILDEAIGSLDREITDAHKANAEAKRLRLV